MKIKWRRKKSLTNIDFKNWVRLESLSLDLEMDSEMSEIPRIKPNSWMPSKSNKVNDESSTSESSEPSKLIAVKRKWNGFVESSTLHGLQHVFASRSPCRRLIWAVFLLLGMAWFSYQSSKLVTKYYSYPVTTKVTQVYENAPEFPAVTICNFNMFRTSAVLASEYGDIFTYVLRYSKGIDVSNDTVDWSKYDKINLTEFTLLTGHQIEQTLSSCAFNGEHCTAKNFTAVVTSMGLCYTFNSGKFFRFYKLSLYHCFLQCVYYCV